MDFQEDSKKLLTEHRENLIQVNSKLVKEKNNIAQSFENKLNRRRLRREMTVMDLAVPVSTNHSLTCYIGCQ